MGTMGKKVMRFLKVSLIAASFFCVLIYNIQMFLVNRLSEAAINQLGVIYMSGMSEQAAAHFGSIIELRVSQVEALVDAVPPGRFKNDSSLQIELTYNARSAGFDHLAFYTRDGEFRMIYGPNVTADVPEALSRSVQNGERNICAGVDDTGVPVVLVGVPAQYNMPGGGTSIGLVAGLPSGYLSETLENSIEADMLEYSILRNDGSYIIQSTPAEEAGYFERIQNQYEPYRGTTPEQYALAFKDALEQDRDYTGEVMCSGRRWNVYCTNLPNSEWHLLLKMPYNNLDETVEALKGKWSLVFGGGCALILCSLLLVFVGYYRLSRRQICELDEARKSAERANRAKNVFLSNMNHDIRTPMNGIMGMTSIAINSLDDPPRVRSCLKKINVSSRHLLGLINDMLDMSKIENGRLSLHMEPVSLRDIMQNIITVVMPQIQEKNQRLRAYVHNIRCEEVCSDRVRLSQILINILGNAVKFTQEGGTITVELSEEPSPKGDAYIRSCLHIGDNGIGMPEEFKSHIFEGFAREDDARVGKEAGAGMGMAISKAIVDAMGGTILVESEQGRGSDFYVSIDMEKTAWHGPEFVLPAQDVLVVDGDEKAAQTVGKTMDAIGLCGEWALSLNQALAMAEKRGYAIVLVDWDLAGGDGMQAALVLRSCLGKDTAVLLMSDGDNDEMEAEAERAGLDGVIAKPVFRSSLYYSLRRFAEKAQPVADECGEPDLTGRRILVAEDNEMNWEIAEMLLSSIGAELDWAENGRICVDKLSQAPEGWYDAVLMDLRMPVMTGFEAACAIRTLPHKDAARIPIIAVSADAFADDIKKCMDCGMNAHTSKPFDLEKVAALLQQYMDKK